MPHEIHVSERRSFRGCRRRWDWAYREGYLPDRPIKALEFGIAYHTAMQEFYSPERWDSTTYEEKLVYGLEAFINECEKQKDKYLDHAELGELPEEVESDYNERVDLGAGMLAYHAEYVHTKMDNWFKPVAVEIPFSVPIRHPDAPSNPLHCRNSPACGQNHNNAGPDSFVTYDGRVDLLVEDIRYGGYFIWDHKVCTLDTPILTPTGWTTHGEVQVGDKIIGSNGTPITVTGVYPKPARNIWEVHFIDGTIVRCGDDHPFIIQYRQTGISKTGTKTNRLVSKKLTAREIRDLPKSLQGKVWVPKIKPVEFKQTTKLPMDPYALGALIGDGYLNNQYHLQFSSKSGETVELLRHVAPEGTQIKRSSRANNSWYLTGNLEWRDTLRILGLWGKKSAEKFIPKNYLFASIDDRVALLQGLMDTDGDTKKYRFSTMSDQLANDFCHLVWSLGGTASKSKNQDNLWKITFQVAFECHRLERKRVGKIKSTYETHRTIVGVVETSSVEPLLCISVDAEDFLYTVNNFILTHNTTSQLAKDDGFLQLDDQIGSYAWALKHVLDLDIRGFIYAETRKDFPRPPEPLKRMMGGRSFSASKTQATSLEIFEPFVATHDPLPYNDGAYDAYLSFLRSAEATQFSQRFVIVKSDAELENIGRNIALEAADMVDSRTRIYPSVGRYTCSTCAFRQPCLAKFQDEDETYLLENNYIKTDRRYWMEQQRSSEKSAK